MKSISVPIILRNCVKLAYPVERVIQSVVGLADEIVLSVDPTSEDSSVDYVHSLAEKYSAEVIYSPWDMNNISSKGAEFDRQTDISFEACSGEWILALQADEAVHEKDFDILRECTENSLVNAYSMYRLYFYGDIYTIRKDWTTSLIRFFRKGTRKSFEGCNTTEGRGLVEHLRNIYIYHYSRIGDPKVLSSRIRSLDGFFHSTEKLIDEKDLPDYVFDGLYNFDCFHKESVDVGRRKSKDASLVSYTQTHPLSFSNYKG